MEGITILNEYVSTDWIVGLVPLILSIALLIVFIWAAVVMFNGCETGPGIGFSVLGFLCACLIMVGVFIVMTPPETHYQVIVDDSVSMNDFNERYEIIEQEGQIITVKEREANE